MKRIAQMAAGLLIATSALANDTMASHGAGGLALKRTDAIDMVSEDLFVSAKEIRVHYVFRNRTPNDVETIVAFPTPENDLEPEYQGWGDQAFPSNFRTTVDGKRVNAQVERKALLNGKDYTALLNRLHVPISPDSSDKDVITPALDRLSAANKRQLLSLGLIGNEDENGAPRWSVQRIWWWTQRFPAGRDVIVDHSYVPGAGGSTGTEIGSSNEPYVREEIARYCVDKEFLTAIRRLDKANRTPMPTWIDYILTTGANWRSPIGSFRLVVDKGQPSNLVSFCETGVKKINPTQYEVRHTKWRPTRDLHVLIIEPAR